MPDPLERRPENREIVPDHAPSMPTHLPTEDTDNPHSTPLRKDIDHDELDPDLPSEPSRDKAP
ncbi:hypothetical protein SAMN06295905_1078 [Devosia lucknowensis]|uniref:Uncharacterized protein n=1 Tax=Devosia lucknowensis TaxID=1096929 RepID=A0A1Y6EQ85_9HYPH|nr:hypothetical protein [Devosia lucknowensis]SMQ64858.1 hypothetical protein SAMN06295905_1078 [Devosia lucknowensis]